ncbi:MAG: hypothetical protein ACXWUI_15930, partial [Burkholderiales bacterium]
MSTAAISPSAHQHADLVRALVSSARWSIALASACALLALVGWILSIDLLMRFVPEWPLARPTGLVSTLVTAAALVLVLSRLPSRRAAGQLL